MKAPKMLLEWTKWSLVSAITLLLWVMLSAIMRCSGATDPCIKSDIKCAIRTVCVIRTDGIFSFSHVLSIFSSSSNMKREMLFAQTCCLHSVIDGICSGRAKTVLLTVCVNRWAKPCALILVKLAVSFKDNQHKRRSLTLIDLWPASVDVCLSAGFHWRSKGTALP